MPDNHDRLLDILKKEYELYEELYKIAGEKKDILLKEDIDQLAELVSEEEGLLLELKELEEERLSLEMDSIHLKDEFIELKKQLKNLAESLKQRNYLNSKLIDNSLSLINLNLNLIKDYGGKKIYDKKGLVAQQASAFINKRA
ncbi:MAG: flagellar export chaperone FlgN [Halanaerobiales bacterium]|jgi:flagellar biosynthesis/type III secretory pathway chaperone|nr:flagellar export chaperone FlgN [Bacillota bacterium]